MTLELFQKQTALQLGNIERIVIPSPSVLEKVMNSLPPPRTCGADYYDQYVEYTEPNVKYDPWNSEAPQIAVFKGTIRFFKFRENNSWSWIYVGAVKL